MATFGAITLFFVAGSGCYLFERSETFYGLNTAVQPIWRQRRALPQLHHKGPVGRERRVR